MAQPTAAPHWPRESGTFSFSRQEIFSNALDVYGYELFFEGDTPREGIETDGPELWDVIDFREASLDAMVGSCWAFINLNRTAILSGSCRHLPTDRVVLEILEDVPADAAVVGELRSLRERGFRIALDDFVYDSEREPLLELASILKIDVLATPDPELTELARSMRAFDVDLVAEKVETRSDLERVRQLGFDYFQGFYLSRPVTTW